MQDKRWRDMICKLANLYREFAPWEEAMAQQKQFDLNSHAGIRAFMAKAMAESGLHNALQYREKVLCNYEDLTKQIDKLENTLWGLINEQL